VIASSDVIGFMLHLGFVPAIATPPALAARALDHVRTTGGP
jgi:hypothetical protein